MKTSVEKSPGWLRGIQIGLGIITVILSIYALQFPADAFRAAVIVLGIILFIVGIEKIITGIFLPIKGKWVTIGLGILVLIFAGFAISFPDWTAFVVTILVGLALLFNGCARIIEGVVGKHSGWAKFFLIGVGILSIVIGTVVLASPLFGAVFVGLIIAIGLLITGIQMIAVGAAGRSIIPDTPSTT
ncbi:MAG TPA: DUF308 domain-containing protein [Nitrososphaeraceae archaeon]|nr:DUF308 domain-containing protein [Nitrososphaeraceae archaeon]